MTRKVQPPGATSRLDLRVTSILPGRSQSDQCGKAEPAVDLKRRTDEASSVTKLRRHHRGASGQQRNPAPRFPTKLTSHDE